MQTRPAGGRFIQQRVAPGSPNNTATTAAQYRPQQFVAATERRECRLGLERRPMLTCRPVNRTPPSAVTPFDAFQIVGLWDAKSAR